jgi:hypothetical protein
MRHNHDPAGEKMEAAARKRGGSHHRHMLKTGGASHHERAAGGAIPGEARIKEKERMDDEGRKRGGKVHGGKPKMRLDKKARGGACRAEGGAVAARKDGGRMTPKSPLTGAGGHTPPFPHADMPIDTHGEGSVANPRQGKHGTDMDHRKRGGHVKKRAKGGAVEKSVMGKGAAGKRHLEHADSADAKEGGEKGRRYKADGRPGGAPPKSRKLDAESGAGDERYAGGGRLTARARQKLPRSDFALPGKGEGPKGAGSGSYPVPDAKHGRLALAMVSRHGSPAQKAAVRAKVHAKFPDIGQR